MNTFTQIIIGSFIIFYLLPLVARLIHKKLFTGYLGLVVLIFLGMWGQHFYVTSSTNSINNTGAGDSLGLAIFVFSHIVFILGVIAVWLTNKVLSKYIQKMD